MNPQSSEPPRGLKYEIIGSQDHPEMGYTLEWHNIPAISAAEDALLFYADILSFIPPQPGDSIRFQGCVVIVDKPTEHFWDGEHNFRVFIKGDGVRQLHRILEKNEKQAL